MSKLWLALLALVMMGCDNPVYNAFQDAHTFGRLSGKELYYHPDFDTLKTYGDIAKYIRERVNYSTEQDEVTNVSNPEETLRLGYGTCGDFAVLFANIAYFGMGIEMDISAVEIGSRAVVEGGRVNHATPVHDGVVVDQFTGCLPGFEVRYIYSFAEVFGRGM